MAQLHGRLSGPKVPAHLLAFLRLDIIDGVLCQCQWADFYLFANLLLLSWCTQADICQDLPSQLFHCHACVTISGPTSTPLRTGCCYLGVQREDICQDLPSQPFHCHACHFVDSLFSLLRIADSVVNLYREGGLGACPNAGIPWVSPWNSLASQAFSAAPLAASYRLIVSLHQALPHSREHPCQRLHLKQVKSRPTSVRQQINVAFNASVCSGLFQLRTLLI